MNINELNDFELGIVKGILAAENGEDELQVLDAESNLDAQRGIRYGFKKSLKRSFRDSVLSFKKALVAYHNDKSQVNKFNLLDACAAIKDDSDDEGLELLQVDGEFQVGKRFEKSKLDEVNKYLEDNPNKKIILNEEDYVIVGDKTSDSVHIEDAEESEYTLNKVNNNKYQVLKNGEPTYELTKKQTNWQCSCPGFKHRGKCKHMGMLQDVLPKRHPRKELEAYIPEIEAMLEPVFGPMYNESTGEGKWAIVGSFRRNVSTFKDIDIIIECPKSEFERKVLDILEQDPNYENIMHGPDIVRGYYHGWYFDVSRVQPGEWGSYLLYRTGCFTGDTLVLTPRGHKRIDELEPGDEVFSGRGEVTTVSQVTVKVFNSLVNFKSRGSNVQCTLDHKILVAGNGTQGATYNEPRWQHAESLGRYCSLFYPKITLSEEVKVDNSLAFLLGFYMADGNLHARTDCPRNKKNKQSLAYRVKICDGVCSFDSRFSIPYDKREEFIRIFNEYKIPIYSISGGRGNEGTIIIKDKSINEFLLKYGGVTLASQGLTKCFNEEILSWSSSAKMELLKGFFLGDGTFSKSEHASVRFLNTNKSIIEGLYLLTKTKYPVYGIKESVRGSHKTMYSFTVCGQAGYQMYKDLLIACEKAKGVNTVSWSNDPVYTSSFEGAEGFTKILRGKPEIVTSLSSIYVYDIGVEDETHSFLIEDGFTVHNSADFNMKMRGLAKKLGYGLSEHGLFRRDTGEVIAKDSEQEIFNALGLKYVEPENRI